MDMVKHKLFGDGEVISKETINGFTYLNVRFEDRQEKKFAIPSSFETGMMEALGDLKEEVDQAIAEKKAKAEARAAALAATRVPVATTKKAARTTKKVAKKAIPVGPVPDAFEKYLISAGYRQATPGGNPSTVYSYLGAVEAIRAEEGVSWATLKADIDTILPKYDEGGVNEMIGAASHKTYINALKRFAEFVDNP